MPRKPRVFVVGGTYHVYCRAARGERPFVDEAVAEALVAFASSRREALRTYRGVLGRGQEEGWMKEGPGRLPWWRRVGGEDDELQLDPGRPRLDWQGGLQRPAPPSVDAGGVAGAVAKALDVPVEALGGRSRGEALQRARELVMLVGVERCGLKVKELAVVIGRAAGSASRLYAQAAASRRTDPAVTAIAARVTQTLRKSAKRSSRRQ